MKKLLTALLGITVFLISCGGESASSQTAEQITNAMISSGMVCNSSGAYDPGDAPLPQTWTSAHFCELENGSNLKVFTFESERDASMVYDYYDAFTGFLGSWLGRDGLTVMQVSVDVPKAEADVLIGYFEDAVE